MWTDSCVKIVRVYQSACVIQLMVGVRLRGTTRAVVGFKVFLIACVFVTRVRSHSLVYAGTQLVWDERAISWSVPSFDLKQCPSKFS